MYPSFYPEAPPQWKVEPHDLITQEAETATIDCEAKGVPVPKIKWTFGN